MSRYQDDTRPVLSLRAGMGGIRHNQDQRLTMQYILRKAFDCSPDGKAYLPDSILWRQKEQVCVGAGFTRNLPACLPSLVASNRCAFTILHHPCRKRSPIRPLIPLSYAALSPPHHIVASFYIASFR